MSAERGRPRSFDTDTALDQATEVFWRHGFQGASLSELTAATGLSKPSLYAAFGDKEALYLACLNRYVDAQVALQTELLEREPDARTAVERFLRTAVAMQADPKLPGGCFIVNGSADCGGVNTPAAVEAALKTAMLGARERLLKRLQRAAREGQLPPGFSASALAGLFGTLLTGMAVLNKAGRGPAEFEETIATAMALWPADKPRRRVKAG